MDRIPVLIDSSYGKSICRQLIERCDQDEEAKWLLDWRVVSAEEITPEILEPIEIMLAGWFRGEWVQHARNLKWIQFMGAGIEGSLTPELCASDIILTNASGVHETPISEHVIGVMLMFARGLHKCVLRQARHAWERTDLNISELRSATLGIVGLGAIGEGVARRAKALGMRVIATRRHPELGSENVDLMLPHDQLHALLAESDYIVLSVPLTPDTKCMIGESELRVMKPNSVLVNIARGDLIDQDALIRALQEGRIAGAGLDVTTPEPLPADSPLWDMPNVIVTPHVSGLSPLYGLRTAEIFLPNLHAYLRGDFGSMINLVDRKLGY
jgi:phosphoglycerate dehydrogenase-like enzyme